MKDDETWKTNIGFTCRRNSLSSSRRLGVDLCVEVCRPVICPMLVDVRTINVQGASSPPARAT